MPLYEYQCKKCENRFEELVLNGESQVNCPECGSKRVEKAFSTFGVGKGHTSPCGDGGCAMPEAMPCCGSGGCAMH